MIALLAAAFFLLKGWAAMLLFGAVHHEVSTAVPALGFVETLWVVLLVQVLTLTGGDSK